MPISKPKKCKQCGEKFTPTYSTVQIVCTAYCAAKYAKELRKKKEEARKKKEAKKWKEEKKVIKETLEKKASIEKKLEKEINTIVRLLDKGHECISSGRPLGIDIGKYHAGHFHSVGSNVQIRFHLFNIFGQSIEQNKNKGGNPLGYMDGLEATFGTQIKDYCLSLKGHPALHLSREELKEKTVIAKRLIKWIKLQERKFNNEERLLLREKFNQELGIYKARE